MGPHQGITSRQGSRQQRRYPTGVEVRAALGIAPQQQHHVGKGPQLTRGGEGVPLGIHTIFIQHRQFERLFRQAVECQLGRRQLHHLALGGKRGHDTRPFPGVG